MDSTLPSATVPGLNWERISSHGSFSTRVGAVRAVGVDVDLVRRPALDALEHGHLGGGRAGVDDQDALVLVETWNAAVSGRARYAIWVYDLANDGMVRLVREQHLGQSVVYRAN